MPIHLQGFLAVMHAILASLAGAIRAAWSYTGITNLREAVQFVAATAAVVGVLSRFAPARSERRASKKHLLPAIAPA